MNTESTNQPQMFLFSKYKMTFDLRLLFVFHNQHYSGLEEAVYRNIQACKELAQTTRTAYGPNGEAYLFTMMY